MASQRAEAKERIHRFTVRSNATGSEAVPYKGAAVGIVSEIPEVGLRRPHPSLRVYRKLIITEGEEIQFPCGTVIDSIPMCL